MSCQICPRPIQLKRALQAWNPPPSQPHQSVHGIPKISGHMNHMGRINFYLHLPQFFSLLSGAMTWVWSTVCSFQGKLKSLEHESREQLLILKVIFPSFSLSFWASKIVLPRWIQNSSHVVMIIGICLCKSPSRGGLFLSNLDEPTKHTTTIRPNFALKLEWHNFPCFCTLALKSLSQIIHSYHLLILD